MATPTVWESGTLIVVAAFTDEDDTAITPVTMTYSLFDEDGTVMNSIEDTNIPSLSTSVNIVLKGTDLGIADSEKLLRYLVLEGTYNSDLGNGLPLVSQYEFMIKNHKA